MLVSLVMIEGAIKVLNLVLSKCAFTDAAVSAAVKVFWLLVLSIARSDKGRLSGREFSCCL